MEMVQVPAQPGRLINAVSRIGYDPEVALCDLMDNSVDAKATKVSVLLERDTHEESGDPDAIRRYIIADDGSGMDRKALINAFTLGASRTYPSGSLGKFGIGLKSAGLALGQTIALVTKTKDAEKPQCAVLSIADIETSGEYRISLGDAPEEMHKLWSEVAPDPTHGTITVLSDLHENQPSFARFVEYFQRYCATTYHMFLEDTKHPFSILINGNALSPLDPLFMVEAEANGALPQPLDQWTGRTVHLLLAPQELPLGESTKCLVAATQLVHPPSFEEEGKRDEMRDHYGIESDPYTHRPRHGFYVYRNRRIIVMAERFRGIIASAVQAWAFRARLMFDETADRILDLDVKKRHCELPKDSRNNLKAMVTMHQALSQEAWRSAGRRVEQEKKRTKEDIANESIANSPVVELTYAPGTDLSNETAIHNRQELQKTVSKETAGAIQDQNVPESKLKEKAQQGNIVIPVQGLKANAMWLPYPAVEIGKAETVLNKAHSWVAEAYAAAETDPKITVVLHQVFTILARAELEVRTTTWPDLQADVSTKVFDRFRRKASAIGEDLAESLASELKKFDANGAMPEE